MLADFPLSKLIKETFIGFVKGATKININNPS
jgi:hypothetical protein